MSLTVRRGVPADTEAVADTVPLEGEILAHATHGLGHYTVRALHEGLTA